mmetsp:Transcript_54201/g.115698  ORF Transcript_54201/g.115698 Transcript_54201/m.115698 type:complete len:152 (-) Transcript_54201:229-684(-)
MLSPAAPRVSMLRRVATATAGGGRKFCAATAAPVSKPSASSSSGGESRNFAGASASDAFASVAHAGFEVGSEGRFGYSRKYAASWDRIFGQKKNTVSTTAQAKVEAPPQEKLSKFAEALKNDIVLPAGLKQQISALNQDQLQALSTILTLR